MSADDVVSLPNFPEQLNTALGLDSGSLVGGMLAGMIIMMLFLVPVLFLTKGKNFLISLVVGYGGLAIATALTWFPAWIFILLIILTAALMAGKFRDWVT